jgi:hypothetical protein
MARLRLRVLHLAAFVLIGCAAGFSQTTQGLISGRLLNSVTGRPIENASVGFSSTTSNLAGAAPADASGYYYLPLLSPGFYRIRVTAPDFQSQEVQELELTVAARVELDFLLRPLSDVWESGEYKSVFLPGQKTIVTFYGPDVDSSKSGSFDAQKGRSGALESTISEVIDSGEIDSLPLQGRDVYTMLVTQPGVTSDAATGRGLGLAINGQRPTSSNYLLDGVENNNYLITGPLTVVAPEAIQEYRISTNNFSAEYGRTSGFVANAITRAGTERFHGVAYFYIKNDVLNANGFQENRLGVKRIPDKEPQPGFFVGGPILKDRLFFASAYEYFHSGSQQAPFTFLFPGAGLVTNFTTQTALSRQLLTQFPAPVTSSPSALTVQETLAPPNEINRTLAIERIDYNRPNGKDRIMGRVLINRFDRPDFIWTPYKDFVSALNENTTALGINYTRSFSSALTNEARFSVSNDDLHWNRPHPEIPTLVTGDFYVANGVAFSGAALPGSPAFYAYKNVNRSWELLDNVIWTRGQHLITAGAGVLLRSSDGYLTAGRDGEYQFNNVISFAVDSPSIFRAAIDRTALQTTANGFSVPSSVQLPGFNRTFEYHQFFLFAQDTYKITRRFTANYGIRYEFYGGPQNTGATKDALVQLGSGATLAQQLAGSTLVKPTGSGNQQLFGSDPRDFAVRAGASYDLFGTGRTLVRGAYGIFYDRPFDNLWENLRNNNLIVPASLRLTLTAGRFNYLAPVSTVLSGLAPQVINADFPEMTLVNKDLRNGYAQSYFAGVQHRVTNNLTVEVNGLGTYGRRLITTDIVNRDFSTPSGGRFNDNIPQIAYRSDQGFSDYNALTTLVRYRTARGIIQASYTWSHTIDNQSDSLQGDFFDLKFTSIAGSSPTSGRSSFSLQFNPNADRGNSDFDQRHNFVLFSYWNLPAPFADSKFGMLFKNWTVAELAAFRSGFPYSVGGPTDQAPGQSFAIDNRANILDPNRVFLPSPQPVPGGERLLNFADFSAAAPGTLGNGGRNAFGSPGFYNIDLSVARSFGVRWLGEGGRLTFRADAFNVLNHANLGTPFAQFDPTNDPLTTQFGIATFGRQGAQSGFPAVSPLNETPRQIQLSVRVIF